MRLLVLGGTHHVGRAVVETALSQGDSVTTVTRGASGAPAPGTDARYADRTDTGALRAALREDSWDAVVDTWSGAPTVVWESARLLVDRVDHYGYVSSRSVYGWPIPPGLDEGAPTVDADPRSADDTDYAAAKRGAELAVLTYFGDRALLSRAGLILGPYEVVGRLPWWLRRMQRGGRVLAPGPHDRPLQYLDARDLAAWMLLTAQNGVTGTFNAVSRPGHTTMGELLELALEVTGGSADLVWASPEALDAAGIAPWTELPIWVPPTGEFAGLHNGDVSAAYASGLTCRPVRDTVADTWRWLQSESTLVPIGDRDQGLDPDREREVLAAL